MREEATARGARLASSVAKAEEDKCEADSVGTLEGKPYGIERPGAIPCQVRFFTTASQRGSAPDLAPQMLVQELDNHWFNRRVFKKTDPAIAGIEPTCFWI
jgi:hypothetical protein